MKIVFNGLKEVLRSGCGACGKRRVSGHSFVTVKTYIMPSGMTKTFRVGEPQEVSDRDGAFLLSYQTEDENGTRSVFTEIKE